MRRTLFSVHFENPATQTQWHRANLTRKDLGTLLPLARKRWEAEGLDITYRIERHEHAVEDPE